jgi:hypothetical protein
MDEDCKATLEESKTRVLGEFWMEIPVDFNLVQLITTKRFLIK